MASQQKPTIVLVAGAWHRASVYDPVKSLLESQGYPVQAVSLLSAGGPTSTTIEDDAAHIRRTALNDLIAQGKEVVMVLHSFAGIPGGESIKGLTCKDRAAQGQAGGVVALVYLAAWVLTAGQSVVQFIGGEDKLTIEDNKVIISDPAQMFYNDLDSETAAKCMAELVHQGSAGVYNEVTYEPYRDIPTIYLMCEKDNAFPFEVQKMMVLLAGDGAIKSQTSPTGHIVMQAAPQTVVDVIEKAVAFRLE